MKERNKEYMQLVLESKKRVDYAFEQIDKHSREFDRKVNRILASL